MNSIRGFTGGKSPVTPLGRSIEDAPAKMRIELIDLFFSLCSKSRDGISEEKMCQVIAQSLGMSVAAHPYAGYRKTAEKTLSNADWPRVYDLICRIYLEAVRIDFSQKYVDGVNKILAAYSTAWELDADGELNRIIPAVGQQVVDLTIAELMDSRFASALDRFKLARDAFDARPRRESDVCKNIFDSMESVAKEMCGVPGADFDKVLKQLRKRSELNNQIIDVLEKLTILRHRNFGHGMTTPFTLSPSEVDFTYLTCIAGILLFVRMK